MRKVWIDPGHGGVDPGALGAKNRREKDDNLRYALALRELLTSRGIGCVMTRVSDTQLSVDKKKDYALRCALERGCDLAICCHRNAGVATASGAEIWLHSRAGDSILAWASDVVRGMEAAGMPIRMGQDGRRGVYRGYPGFPSDNFYCNSGTASPSMLIELGFVTNPSDNDTFDRTFPMLVQAIADATCRKLGVKWPSPKVSGRTPAI